MKMIKIMTLLLPIAATLFVAPGFADAPASQTSSLANNTASIARSTVSMAQDTAITTYIYAKLAAQPNIANDNIDISTNQGKVTVNGIVNSDTEAKTITQLAQSTSGVKSVDASKIIVAQQNNALYIKTATEAKAPEPFVNSDNNIQLSSSQKTAVSATDPILTSEEASQPEKSGPTEILETQKKSPRAGTAITKPQHAHTHHKNHKTKKHTAKKLKKHTKKHVKKQYKQPVKKIGHPSKSKQALKKQPAHPTLKPSKKQSSSKKQPANVKTLPAQRKTNTASVDEMTKNFLNTALLANKTIPAEE